MAKRPATVRIEQPTANKVIVFSFAGVAGFLALIFLTNVGGGVFGLFFVVFLGAVLAYSYRAIQVVAIAGIDGIDVRNLFRNRKLSWDVIDGLSVGKTGSGPGTGISVELLDGTSVPIEASWGPWHQGKVSDANTVRCERFIAKVAAMRNHDPALDEPDEPVWVDPIVVRPTTADDVDAVAETIDAAWRETFSEILPMSTLSGRDPGADAEMLRDLLGGAIPGTGSLLVEHSGEIVGASVFGPTNVDGLDGFTEIYMLYVRAAAIGKGPGRRLVSRTFGAIRSLDASGIVGHVYVNNRRFRSQVKRLGIQAHGDTQEQIWYGLPVQVVEYRFPLRPGHA
ncbi:MAG: PH domain-containing protein [Actinomycetia bacterium]|nr:PH domain-containing protein [Actinomycetes bacterium]